MKKRILSLVLATVLICAMAIPVSASSYYSWGEYASSTYEIMDTCNNYDYSSQTFCDSAEYGLKSDVDEYKKEFALDGSVVHVYMGLTKGTTTVLANSTSATKTFLLSKIRCTHYVNGQVARTVSVSAG